MAPLKRLFDMLLAGGPLAIVLLGICLLLLLILFAANKRWWLVTMYVLALMLSGFHVGWINAGATLLRWAVLFALALTVVFGLRSPGLAAWMIGALATWGLLWLPAARLFHLSVLKEVLLWTLAWPAAAAMAGSIHSRQDVRRFLKIIMVAGGLYLILGLTSLGQLRGGERFSGAYEAAAPLFVLTGGLLLPLGGWGAMHMAKRSQRIACGIGGVLIFALCVLSGQRTGLYAGIIGCIPLVIGVLVRQQVKYISIITTVVVAAIIGATIFIIMFPSQIPFLTERYSTLDTTGREALWEHTLAMCLSDPLAVRGMGYSNVVGAPHNAFLCIWGDFGIVGLILFCGAILTMTIQSLLMAVSATDTEASDIGLLLLGWMLASIAAGFFESKLNSPSNVAIFLAVSTSVLLTRMRHMPQTSPSPAQVAGLPGQPLGGDLDFGLLIQQYYG